MEVLFFRKNIVFVNQYLKNVDNACAFWYAPGLLSYAGLDSIIDIVRLHIEEHLLKDFSVDFPELVQKFEIITFKDAQESLSTEDEKTLCFLASNDTIVKSFKPVFDIYDNHKSRTIKLFCKPAENAGKEAARLNLQFNEINVSISKLSQYGLLILSNDWGPTEQKIVQDFYAAGKNVVCIQESSIDFNPIDNRMGYCSFPVFQGIATLQNINVNKLIAAVIGNPRFEELKVSPMPAQNRALVNVNFTYGIFEEVRSSWVEDIVSSCNELGLDYVLSQHPRDNGDLSGYNLLKSNSAVVHDTIKESSVVISRFSALLIEAVCLGRPAIYYNPHKENMHYKFETDNKMFFCASSKTELKAALAIILKNDDMYSGKDDEFVKKHLGVTNAGMTSEYIKMVLEDVIKYPPLKRASTLKRWRLKAGILKRMILRQRY